MDLYFRMRYTEQINSAVVEDGKVIAALQRIPYPMTFAGDVVPTAIFPEPVRIRISGERE